MTIKFLTMTSVKSTSQILGSTVQNWVNRKSMRPEIGKFSYPEKWDIIFIIYS